MPLVENARQITSLAEPPRFLLQQRSTKVNSALAS
jgi:hypothetical protein